MNPILVAAAVFMSTVFAHPFCTDSPGSLPPPPPPVIATIEVACGLQTCDVLARNIGPEEWRLVYFEVAVEGSGPATAPSLPTHWICMTPPNTVSCVTPAGIPLVVPVAGSLLLGTFPVGMRVIAVNSWDEGTNELFSCGDGLSTTCTLPIAVPTPLPTIALPTVEVGLP